MTFTPDIALLSGEDAVVVYRLIEQLCEQGTDPKGWRKHLVAELVRLFDASMAISYLTKLSTGRGNIAPKILYCIEHGASEAWRKYLAKGELMRPCMVERFGTDFTRSLAECIDDATWRASDHSLYSQVGVTCPGVIDGIVITRRPGARAYSPRDVAMLRLIHQELLRLWRKHDPLDTHTLPARQREVLEGIRRGESRKTIAEKMCVSDHTVHTYEKAIFDRAKVTSRLELLSVLSKLVRPVLMP